MGSRFLEDIRQFFIAVDHNLMFFFFVASQVVIPRFHGGKVSWTKFPFFFHLPNQHSFASGRERRFELAHRCFGFVCASAKTVYSSARVCQRWVSQRRPVTEAVSRMRQCTATKTKKRRQQCVATFPKEVAGHWHFQTRSL